MIFETERCIVNPICCDDKRDLISMCGDINVWEYLGGANTAVAQRRKIENHEKLPPEQLENQWIIRNKADNTFMGYLSLNTHHDGDDIELSYMLLSKYWGSGYASEVAGEFIRYAFNERKLNRLVAETQSANIASCKLLEKLGFHKLKELIRFDAKQTLYALDNPVL